MENAVRVELASQNNTEYRSVGLQLESGGAIKIDAHDMGPTVKQFWDHDDYEFSVTIPATEVARLAFELLKERFAGNLGAVDALRSFCDERSIKYEFFSWP